VDTTEYSVFANVGQQLYSWFNMQTYPLYIMVAMFFLPFAFMNDNTDTELAARGNCVRLQGFLLLVRLGLVYSMTVWMWCAFRQPRPCMCRSDSSLPFVNLYGLWGMPSGESMAATVIGFHFIEKINIPLGIFFIVVMAGQGIAIGMHSFGQVLVGIIIGVALHFYSTRTPTFARVIDIVLNFIAGIITLVMTKQAYPNGIDCSFAMDFVIGIAWQVYAAVMVFVIFDWEFVKMIMRKNMHTLHDVDFLYYRPLNAPNDGPDQPAYADEYKWGVLVTVVFFFILCGLRILTPDVNSLLSEKYFN